MIINNNKKSSNTGDVRHLELIERKLNREIHERIFMKQQVCAGETVITPRCRSRERASITKKN